MDNRFELPSELNIYSVLESRDALLAWVSERATQAQLEVSASNVSEIDGSGLQLLASLSSTHPGWQLLNPSAAFEDACRTLGFAHWLDAPAEPAAKAPAKPKATSKAKAKSAKEPSL